MADEPVEWSEGLLEGILGKAERERAEAVERLKAQGIEPAPIDGQVYAGLPLVSFTLRPLDAAHAEVRLRFQDDAGEDVSAWGEEWPRPGDRVDAGQLLSTFAACWGEVAGKRCTVASGFPTGVFAPLGLRTLEITHGPNDLRVSCMRGARSFGAEGVLFVCTMMALADTLAAHLGPEAPASAAWRKVREATDLPPSDVEGEGPLVRDTFVEQTTWLARRLGIDVEAYRLAAVDVHARQILAAADGVESPAREEWDPSYVPAGLDLAVAAARASRAVEAMLALDSEMTPERFHREAVTIRNADAWQKVFYPRPEAPTESPAP